MRLASLDTCFLIDWALYRRRNYIIKIFDKILISEHVLREIYSGKTLDFVTELLSKGFMTLIPLTSQEEEIARRLITIALSDPRIPELHETEVYAVAIALTYNTIIVTENKAVLWLKVYYPNEIPQPVWRSIDVLLELVKKSVIKVNNIEDALKIIEEYSIDVKHSFSHIDIRRFQEEVMLWLTQQNS